MTPDRPDRPPVEGEVVDPAPALAPAATPPSPTPRTRRVVSPASRRASDAALVQLETTLGSRAALVDALALAPTADGIDADRATYILGLLADPKYADRSLRVIARLAGITLGELLKLYRAAAVQRAHLEAMSAVTKTLPAVAAHVMARAIPYELDCYACGGVGQVTPEPTKKDPNPGPETCTVCRGAGRLRHEPDLEHQKLALSLGGLLKGGGAGTTVNIQQVQAQQGQIPLAHGDGLLQLQKLSDQALYGPAEEED